MRVSHKRHRDLVEYGAEIAAADARLREKEGYSAKLSAARKGDKNPRWLGGISREPYGWKWNEELREEVRRRDSYKCQVCGTPQAECARVLSVHHINYDKKDNDPLNLVALCLPCHVRTNTRRAYWTAFFEAMRLGFVSE